VSTRGEAASRSVLVVDDDEIFRTRMVRAFIARGWDARGAVDAPAALALAGEDSPEFAVVDLRMPGPSGLELVRGLREIDDTTRVVMLTGYGSIATAVEAVKLGAAQYLTKPADLDDVLAAFERLDAPAGTGAPAPTEVPTLARMEWEHINRVLSDCGGNVSQAARLLGLHRRSLQRKLAKYPVPR
jgi:two-component system, response regulator RegA